MYGALGQAYQAPQRFSFTSSWRYSKSDRHYVGRHYQEERDHEGSQVINRVSTMDFNFKWNINDRWTISSSLPYQRATRSSPLRAPGSREVVTRSDYRADGIGDMVVAGRYWIMNPETHRTGNVQIGFGLKLPTGNDTLKSYRYQLRNGKSVRTDEQQYVDRSVMPGDGGGIGYLIDVSWFQAILQGRMTFYTSAGYLMNPKERNHATGNSVPDQYVARVGAIFSGPKWKGVGVGLGGRLEGSPYQDFLGDDAGARRPGYSIAIEPSVSWSRGPNSLALAVPYRMFANRTRNVGDIQNDGHGDAAFADYVVLLGYTRRFGEPVGTASKAKSKGDKSEPKPEKSSCVPELLIKEDPAVAAASKAIAEERYREAINESSLENGTL